MIYKFVSHEIRPLEAYKENRMYILHEKLANGQAGQLTREEKDLLVFMTREPVYKQGGWAFDFRDYLNRYWVKRKHARIDEVWAWDKTALRKHAQGSGDPIVEIVEVENQ